MSEAVISINNEGRCANACASRKTILLIEDDTMLLKHLRTLLRFEGHRVLTATNVSEAEEAWAIAHERIDVILSDNMLESDRGVDLVARFRAQQPGVKIVLCSGRPLEREVPDTQFLMKPFSAATLLAALN